MNSSKEPFECLSSFGTNRKTYNELKSSPAECLNYIIECLAYDRISVLVGAGFSKNAIADFPDWNELLIPMVKEIDGKYKRSWKRTVLNHIKDIGTFAVVDAYLKKKSHREVVDVYIENQLEKYNKNPNTLELHKLLLQLNWCDVFTTNWDTLLEQANKRLSSTDISYQVVKRAKDLCLDNKKRIVKLHGTLRDDESKNNDEYGFDDSYKYCYVLGKSDFKNYHIDHSDFSSFMRVKILETPIVLLGFSGTDSNFLYWVNLLKNTMIKGGNTHEPNPIFLISTNDNDVTEEEKLFYANNYIISIKLSELYDFIIMQKNTYKKKSKKCGKRTRNIYNELKVLFEYLKERTDEKINLSYIPDKQITASEKVIKKISSPSNELEDFDKEKYLQVPKFLFQNLNYSLDLFATVYRFSNFIDSLTVSDFSMIYNVCLNNFYSLGNMFQTEQIPLIAKRYVENVFFKANGNELLFAELLLKYYRETNKIQEFDELLRKLDSKQDETAKDISFYQKGLNCIYRADDYENLKRLSNIIEDWKPENNNQIDSLFVLRKVHLIESLKNSYEVQGYSDKIQPLLKIAEENCPKSEKQLLVFIYEKQLKFNFEKEKVDKIQALIKSGYKTSSDFINTLFAESKNAKTSDDEGQKRNAFIYASRILNFDEYTGSVLNFEHNKESILGAIINLKDSLFYLFKMLIALIPSLGESTDEKNLMLITSKILRYISSEKLKPMFNYFFEIFKFKIDNTLNAKIYFFILIEICKRNDGDFVQLLIAFMKEKITKKNFVVLNGLAAGQIGGWKEPFCYLLSNLKDDGDFDFFADYILKEYVADEQELRTVNSYAYSEFLNYFISLIQNKNISNERKVIFLNNENIIKILKGDSDLDSRCELCLFAFEYLNNELKEKTVAWLEKNYSNKISPYFIKYVAEKKSNSLEMKNRLFEIVENHSFASYTSMDYSLSSIVKGFIDNFTLSDDELLKLASSIYSNFSKIKIDYDKYYYKNYYNSIIRTAYNCFIEIKDKLQNDNDKKFSSQLKDLSEKYENANNEISTLDWIDSENLKQFANSFAYYVGYCSYTNRKDDFVFVLNLALSKILTQNSSELEDVLQNIAGFNENKIFVEWMDNAQTKLLLNHVVQKFKKEIPDCYDDLRVMELIKKIEDMESK